MAAIPSAPAATQGMTVVFTPVGLGIATGCVHGLGPPGTLLLTGQPQLVPSAEEVRFTMSGTEATLLAMRLARAYTGRRKILKFEAHFHGWHDYALIGDRPPFDQLPQGVLDSIPEDMVLTPRKSHKRSSKNLHAGKIRPEQRRQGPPLLQ